MVIWLALLVSAVLFAIVTTLALIVFLILYFVMKRKKPQANIQKMLLMVLGISATIWLGLSVSYFMMALDTMGP